MFEIRKHQGFSLQKLPPNGTIPHHGSEKKFMWAKKTWMKHAKMPPAYLLKSSGCADSERRDERWIWEAEGTILLS
ncbi:MAG: hypothetical protein ABR907_05110 [Terracidiphilus sp.]|jgi:hypothetical protein